MEDVLKILVVEDNVVIAKLIEQHMIEAGHEVVEIAYKYKKALKYLDELNPDLVLLDINLGVGQEGLLLGELINIKYKIPFIYLTSYSDNETLQRAKEAQPCGYVVKPYKAEDLYTAITIGLYNYSKRQTGQELTKIAIQKLAVSPLSEREFEIIMDITKGLTNSQIAGKQYLTINTIKWHIQNIYSKMQVKNRTSLVQKVFKI